MKRLLLGGEGRNELGGWCDPPSYRHAPPERGVLETLLRKAAPDGWEIADAVRWKDIRKYRPGGHRQAEHRNVLGLALMAREHGLDAVVFCRDKDAETPEAEERERSVSKAIEEAKRDFKLIVVGGVAIQRLESWVLACFGTRGSERMLRAEVDRRLSEAGVDAKRTESMVRLIESADSADLDRLPDDAHSLRTWLDEARGLAATD
ncbi:MAG: hypothetical protein ACOX6T_01540 [Myxococcales bacterium]|jgi:hypothetical protein